MRRSSSLGLNKKSSGSIVVSSDLFYTPSFSDKEQRIKEREKEGKEKDEEDQLIESIYMEDILEIFSYQGTPS